MESEAVISLEVYPYFRHCLTSSVTAMHNQQIRSSHCMIELLPYFVISVLESTSYQLTRKV